MTRLKSTSKLLSRSKMNQATCLRKCRRSQRALKKLRSLYLWFLSRSLQSRLLFSHRSRTPLAMRGMATNGEMTRMGGATTMTAGEMTKTATLRWPNNKFFKMRCCQNRNLKKVMPLVLSSCILKMRFLNNCPKKWRKQMKFFASRTKTKLFQFAGSSNGTSSR